MITRFNPTVSNNRNQRQNFCAINQKHYEKAQSAVNNKVTYDYVLRDLYEAFVAKDVSHKDTIDTLDAIKAIYPEKMKKWVDETKEDIAEYLKK